MAKTSKIARDEQRRAALKRLIASPHATPEARRAAVVELQRQPRDASATRVRNRDVVDGRPRGYVGAFGLSRIRLRQLAHRGELPGVTKSSW